MITLTRGNLLEAETEALVNTVNTAGVMGKGIALQFKRAFPENYEAYRRACDQEQVRLGEMFVVETGRLAPPRYIVNFPTKGHWRSRSNLEDIENGLADLARVIREEGIRSIAIPPLGCGHGGLDWDDVRPRIEAALADLDDVDIRLYEPAGAPDPRAMPDRRKRPKVTPSRAVLLELMERYGELVLRSSPTDTAGCILAGTGRRTVCRGASRWMSDLGPLIVSWLVGAPAPSPRRSIV